MLVDMMQKPARVPAVALPYRSEEPGTSCRAQGVDRAAVHTSQHPRGAAQSCSASGGCAAAPGGGCVAGVLADDGHGEPLDGGPPHAHQDAAPARLAGHAPPQNAVAAPGGVWVCRRQS